MAYGRNYEADALQWDVTSTHITNVFLTLPHGRSVRHFQRSLLTQLPFTNFGKGVLFLVCLGWLRKPAASPLSDGECDG